MQYNSKNATNDKNVPLAHGARTLDDGMIHFYPFIIEAKYFFQHSSTSRCKITKIERK